MSPDTTIDVDALLAYAEGSINTEHEDSDQLTREWLELPLLVKKLVAGLRQERERADEHERKWQAIYDPKAFPTSDELQGALKSIPPRIAAVIDRSFAEGATLQAAYKYEADRSVAAARGVALEEAAKIVESATYAGTEPAQQEDPQTWRQSPSEVAAAIRRLKEPA